MALVIETPTKRHDVTPERSSRLLQRAVLPPRGEEGVASRAPRRARARGRYTLYTCLGRLKIVYVTAGDVVEHTVAERSLVA